MATVTNFRNKKVLILILLMLITVFSSGQVSTDVWVEIEPNEPIINQVFDLKVHIKAMSQDTIRVIEPSLPVGLSFISGPALETIVTGESEDKNNASSKQIISYTLKARKAKRYVIDGFLLRIEEESIYTRETVINIKEEVNKKIIKPLVFWTVATDNLMVGETTSLDLILFQYGSLQFPERIDVRPPLNAWFESYESEKTITEKINVAGEITGYFFPISSYLLTPTKQGRLSIPSARVTVTNENSTQVLFSELLPLNVLEAPQSLSSTGAIGTLRFESLVKKEIVNSNLYLNLHASVEGTGNHRFVSFPEPITKNLIFRDKKIVEDIELRPRGYSGKIETIYSYLVKDPRDYQITVPEFVWYEPTVGVIRKQANSIYLPDSEEDYINISNYKNLKQVQILTNSKFNACYRKPNNWKDYWLVAAGPIMLAIFYFLKRNRLLKGYKLVFLIITGTMVIYTLFPLFYNQKEDFELQAILEKAELSYQNGNYVMASENFYSAKLIHNCDSTISYNIAISELSAGNKTVAMAWLRQAIRESPNNNHYRRELSELEKVMKVESNHSPAFFLSKAVFFYSTIVLFHIVIVFTIFRKQGGYKSLFFTGVLYFLIGTSIFLFFHSIYEEKKIIKVFLSSQLRKIPLKLAKEWIPIPDGTTLQIKGEYNNFFLVKTAYGLDAWVDLTSTLTDTEIISHDK